MGIWAIAGLDISSLSVVFPWSSVVASVVSTDVDHTGPGDAVITAETLDQMSPFMTTTH